MSPIPTPPAGWEADAARAVARESSPVWGAVDRMPRCSAREPATSVPRATVPGAAPELAGLSERYRAQAIRLALRGTRRRRRISHRRLGGIGRSCRCRLCLSG